MSLQVAVLADDLSGGNSIGVEFARRGYGTLLMRSSEAPLQSGESPDVLVIDTATRNLPSDQAYAINHQAAEMVRKQRPAFVIKKIDSLLRGPIAAELEAVANAFGLTRGLVIPASPKAGRTTVQGRQWIGGAPLLSALPNLDPSAHLATDDIAALLSSACRRRVARLDLGAIKGGQQAISERLAEIGDGFIVADCETQQDLAAAVEASVAAGILYFAGSYGLGEALSEALASLRVRKPVLVIAGSLSEATRRQVARLSKDPSCHVLALDPYGARGDADPEICLRSLIAEANSALKRGQNLVLHTRGSLEKPEDIQHRSESENRELASDVERLLAALVRPLLPSISGLAISGGATADAVLGALDGHGFRVTEHELMPGIPVVRVYGGRWDGLPCVTKPGSFGAEDALAAILNFLRTRSVPTTSSCLAMEGSGLS